MLAIALVLWIEHAIVSCLPVLLAKLGNDTMHVRPIQIVLMWLPFVTLVLAHFVYPVGAAASMMLRVAILTGIVALMQIVLCLPFVQRAHSGWSLLAVLLVMASILPIQYWVPSLHD